MAKGRCWWGCKQDNMQSPWKGSCGAESWLAPANTEICECGSQKLVLTDVLGYPLDARKVHKKK